jgi:hypothetical protein
MRRFEDVGKVVYNPSSVPDSVTVTVTVTVTVDPIRPATD